MKLNGSFWTGLFLAGWLFHAVVSSLWSIPVPSPQWLLLAVLAVGSIGRVAAAETLGFFWGLMLDAQGSSLFGAQGWILAAAGFAVGRLSRQVDAEKALSQVILAAGGTLFYLVFLAQSELLFRGTGVPHVPPIGAALAQLLINAAAAPLVFRLVRAAGRRFLGGEESHAYGD